MRLSGDDIFRIILELAALDLLGDELLVWWTSLKFWIILNYKNYYYNNKKIPANCKIYAV